MAEREVPEGYRLEWQIDLNWEVGGHGMRCRKTSCDKRASASLLRKHGLGSRWWYYCADHLYGRRIRDGIVEFERLVEMEAKPLATKEGRE